VNAYTVKYTIRPRMSQTTSTFKNFTYAESSMCNGACYASVDNDGRIDTKSETTAMRFGKAKHRALNINNHSPKYSGEPFTIDHTPADNESEYTYLNPNE